MLHGRGQVAALPLCAPASHGPPPWVRLAQLKVGSIVVLPPACVCREQPRVVAEPPHQATFLRRPRCHRPASSPRRERVGADQSDEHAHSPKVVTLHLDGVPPIPRRKSKEPCTRITSHQMSTMLFQHTLQAICGPEAYDGTDTSQLHSHANGRCLVGPGAIVLRLFSPTRHTHMICKCMACGMCWCEMEGTHWLAS
jgi:hypothetical protein